MQQNLLSKENEMIRKINEQNVEATNTRAATEAKFAELNKKHSKEIQEKLTLIEIQRQQADQTIK
jgi:hypothetical protein